MAHYHFLAFVPKDKDIDEIMEPYTEDEYNDQHENFLKEYAEQQDIYGTKENFAEVYEYRFNEQTNRWERNIGPMFDYF